MNSSMVGSPSLEAALSRIGLFLLQYLRQETDALWSISPTPTFYNWQSSDSGATWSDAAPTAGFNAVINATPNAPVPEPGTWAAAALLVGGAAFARWRRRQN